VSEKEEPRGISRPYRVSACARSIPEWDEGFQRRGLVSSSTEVGRTCATGRPDEGPEAALAIRAWASGCADRCAEDVAGNEERGRTTGTEGTGHFARSGGLPASATGELREWGIGKADF